MTYKTAAALEMAVKAAAKSSPLDTGRAVSGFYFHRLLCRVFSRPKTPFMLKGGQSMLARTVDARATRDIDLLSQQSDLGSALEEIKALAAINLEDFITFEFLSAEHIKTEDEYRSGLNVTFASYLGNKRMQDVSIDLVVNQIPCSEPEIMQPADRINIEGIPACDYRVYPLVNSLADKLCAMVEMHEGRPSSRVKDLVDVVIYATSMDIGGEELTKWVYTEASIRGIELPASFSAPAEWKSLFQATFKKLVSQTGLPPDYADIFVAEALAADLYNPVLDKTVGISYWNHNELAWSK